MLRMVNWTKTWPDPLGASALRTGKARLRTCHWRSCTMITRWTPIDRRPTTTGSLPMLLGRPFARNSTGSHRLHKPRTTPQIQLRSAICSLIGRTARGQPMSTLQTTTSSHRRYARDHMFNLTPQRRKQCPPNNNNTTMLQLRPPYKPTSRPWTQHAGKLWTSAYGS